MPGPSVAVQHGVPGQERQRLWPLGDPLLPLDGVNLATLNRRIGPAIDLRAPPYNVVGDGQSISDANITSGAATLTTTTSTPFTPLDVGKAISVAGAGGNPAGELRTTIARFVQNNQVVLAANATATVTSRTVADMVTNATTTITSATAAFVASDVNTPVTGTNIPQYTVIASVTNGTTAVLSQPAMASGSGGSLTISFGCQWGTDNITGINLWFSGTAATGAYGVLPAGRIVCSQAWRIGINGQVTRTTQVLQGAGGRSTLICWINSNSMGILQTTGASTVTQIPQFVGRDLGFDGLYRGVGTDGIFNRLGTAQLWSLPYPFSNPNVTSFPLGTHGNAYEQSSATYGRTVNDAVTNGTTTVTSATAAFVSGNDAGKAVTGSNIPPNTTIASVTNGTTIVLSNAATGSGSAGLLSIGPATLTDAGRTVADGVTNGTTTITSATIGFTDGSVGRTITGSADIPGGTTIASVTNATTAIMSAAATGSHAAQTFTLGPPTWTNNQLVGQLVFIDEDKATINSPIGSGYGRIQGNTTGGIVQVGMWFGTKRNNSYQPSGAVVRYRIHQDIFQGVHHRLENPYFYRPCGYVTQPTRGEFIYPVIEASGQPPASVHNDAFGSSGTHAVIDHPRFINCAGNMGDFAGTIPGRIPCVDLEMIEDVGRIAVGGLFVMGIGSRIVGGNIDNPAQTGTGYDATTHQANRGGNILSGLTGTYIQAYVSGANGMYGDQIGLNSMQDSPLTQTGALTTIAAFVSGTAQQVTQAGRAAQMMVPVTFTPTAGAAATCVVGISPDNVTFTNVMTQTVPLGTALDSFILPIAFMVPAGWWVKLTVTNATIGTGYIIQ